MGWGVFAAGVALNAARSVARASSQLPPEVRDVVTPMWRGAVLGLAVSAVFGGWRDYVDLNGDQPYELVFEGFFSVQNMIFMAGGVLFATFLMLHSVMGRRRGTRAEVDPIESMEPVLIAESAPTSVTSAKAEIADLVRPVDREVTHSERLARVRRRVALQTYVERGVWRPPSGR